MEEGSTVEGKAMIVCATREIGYAIYKELVAMRPEWKEVRQCADGEVLTPEEEEKIKPIEKVKMVFIRQKDDAEELYNLLGTDEERKRLDLQFKEPKSNFKICGHERRLLHEGGGGRVETFRRKRKFVGEEVGGVWRN